jgi:hypothetical protein
MLGGNLASETWVISTILGMDHHKYPYNMVQKADTQAAAVCFRKSKT